MQPDPFLIQGPAVISFSGGRTSAYMLWRILQAHGGTLPDDVVVCFANTGREMPATLDFVNECATRWGVHVVWLEFTRRARDGFKVVSHNEAARAGEPFEALLVGKTMLPNPVMKFCTQELKIRTIKRHVMRDLGFAHWTSIVGLRADEAGRVERIRKPGKDRWKVGVPLADAGIKLADVLAFWRAQPFDLQLAGKWEGNCDGCFLKSKAAIMRLTADHPQRMEWWAKMEADHAGQTRDPSVAMFRKDRPSYAALAEQVAASPRLPIDETMVEGGEACGTWCGV